MRSAEGFTNVASLLHRNTCHISFAGLVKHASSRQNNKAIAQLSHTESRREFSIAKPAHALEMKLPSC